MCLVVELSTNARNIHVVFLIYFVCKKTVIDECKFKCNISLVYEKSKFKPKLR